MRTLVAIVVGWIAPASAQLLPNKTFAPAFAHTLQFPGNQWTLIAATVVVPGVPPAPSDPDNSSASYFIWLGVQPSATEPADPDQIGNGVLQNVLSFGPSCAPGQPTVGSPYRGWTTSSEYVNTNTNSTAHSGCRGGAFMDALPGDKLKMVAWLSGTDGPNRSLWRLGIERYDASGSPLPCLPSAYGSGTPCTVGFDMEMLGQEQRFAALMVEFDGYANRSFFPAVEFLDISLVANDSEPEFCGSLDAQGQRIQAGFGVEGVTGNSGCEGLNLQNRTTCLVKRCAFVPRGYPRPPFPNATSTPSPTGTATPVPDLGWFESLSTGAKAGFLVGAICAGLLILGLIIWLLVRRGSRQSKPSTSVIQEKSNEPRPELLAAFSNSDGRFSGYYPVPAIATPSLDVAHDAVRPTSVYSIPYPVPYVAVAGNRASLLSKSGNRASVLTSPGGEHDPAALAVSAAIAARRPLSVVLPGTAIAPHGRPVTALFDSEGNIVPPVIMASQPLFVGPDGGYYAANETGMQKLDVPEGYVPASQVMLLPVVEVPGEAESSTTN